MLNLRQMGPGRGLGERSTYLETALRAWGVVPAEPQSPLSTHTWQGWVQQWQALSACTLGGNRKMPRLGWTAPWERYTVVRFSEHFSSAHLTPQLGARSSIDRSWERPAKEATQVPGCTQLPQFLQPH